MSMMIHTTVFRIQSAGTPAQANVGECADVVAGTGSTTTGQSGFSLNGTVSEMEQQLAKFLVYGKIHPIVLLNITLEVSLMSIYLKLQQEYREI